MLFDEGDVFEHVFLELRGVVFEVDGNQGAVAEGMDFLEAVRAVVRRSAFGKKVIQKA